MVFIGMMPQSPSMDPRKRFYSGRVSWKRKVRRSPAGPSFRETEHGKYYVVKNGAKVQIDAIPFDVAGSFGVVFFRKNKKQSIGSFTISKGNGKWVNFHREIEDESLKGYNLGKLGFRLLEQQVMKRGGTFVTIETGQKDSIATALSLGYLPDAAAQKTLKIILNIPPAKSLPRIQEVIRGLQMLKAEDVPQVSLTRQLNL